MDSDADKIIDLYERHAHDYVADRRSVGWNENAWLDRFSALLSQGASILDIGCGSGEPIARYLIDQGFAVDGVDTSPTLMAICRGRFPQRSWHVADMRALALKVSFDGLLAWDSFFHLVHDDQGPVLVRDVAHCRRRHPLAAHHAHCRVEDHIAPDVGAQTDHAETMTATKLLRKCPTRP